MNSEQVKEARLRVNARLQAATPMSEDGGGSIELDALMMIFAGTDLSAEEMIGQIQRECVGLMVRAVGGVPISQLVMGLALREMLLGFELGREFEREAAS